MRERYANRSAVRWLNFWGRNLKFGYVTHLAPWIEKQRVSKKVIIQIKKKDRIIIHDAVSIVERAVYKSGMNEDISPIVFVPLRLVKMYRCQLYVKKMGHSSIATTNIYLERLRESFLFHQFILEIVKQEKMPMVLWCTSFLKIE